MYHKKLTPEESLKLIKLRMNYDSKKTLNENIKIVEQIDISGHIRDINDEVKKFNSNETNVIKILQNYKTKANFDKLAKAYKEKYNVGIGQALYDMINANDPKESQDLKDWAKNLGMNAEAGSIPGTNGRYWEWKFSSVGSGEKSGESKGTQPSIPTELKDIEGVKKFQDWADTNKAGWATGFKEGKLNRGSGYGKFGPRTSKAWNQYKNEYLGGNSTATGEEGLEGGGGGSTEEQPD